MSAAKVVRPEVSAQDLMREMGAPGWDPIPPDQYRWMQTQPQVPNEFRLWSFLMQSTIGFGPGRPRSPWAVNADGTGMTVADVARSLQWDPSNTRREFKRLKLRGVVTAERRDRLRACGTVTPMVEDRDELEDQLRLIDAEPTDGNATAPAPAKDTIPGYIKKHLESLPADRQAEFRAKWAADDVSSARLQADLIQVARVLLEHRKDDICAQFGLPGPKHITHRQKDPEKAAEAGARDKRIQPLVALIRVQMDEVSTDSVQTSDAPVCTETDVTSKIRSHTDLPIFIEGEVGRIQSVGRSVVEENTAAEPDLPTDRLTEISDAIPPQLLERTADKPSPTLLKKIHVALNGAPLELFTRRCLMRCKAVSSLGILESLAKDVGAVWRVQQQAVAAAPPQPAARDPREWAREQLADPTLPAEDRKLILESFPELRGSS